MRRLLNGEWVKFYNRLTLALTILTGHNSFAAQQQSASIPFEDTTCSLAPTLNFMSENNAAYSDENLASAAWFARAVQLSDTPRQKAWDQLAEPPIRVQDFTLKLLGLHATLLEFSQGVLLLYRGTDDALDYVLNGTFFTTQGEKFGLPGWVHQGFQINFSLSWTNVHAALREAAGRGKSITISAHSLGGVLGQYAAWILENEGIPVHRIYAFQAPNPGDVDFKTAYDNRFSGRSLNVIYGEDVTPHVPPIVESAESFSRALPPQLMRVAIQIANKARYGVASSRYRVYPNGKLITMTADDVITTENEFWSSYQSKSGGKPFPYGLNDKSPFIADHDMQKVLCSLARGRHSTAGN